MRAVTLFAPAKVNLFLGVGERRADGYHDVETVLQALDFGDTVRILPADELAVTSSVDLGLGEQDNIAYQAALAFAEQFRVPPRAIIEIEKRTPVGAGLGGGSSDAAAVIAGFARLHGADPLDQRCLAAARSVGADCAFFLGSGTALMTGRGDLLGEQLPTVVCHVAVVRPQVPVSTAAAYEQFDRDPVPAEAPLCLLEALRRDSVADVAGCLANNMTAASGLLVPEVLEALSWLEGQHGVLGTAMAGSGSATFAVCEDETSAATIAAEASAQGWWAVATVTRAAGVEVIDVDEGA
jgi:4-diphosphocytidyl-2-C-methyl-D-erythritol kinase